MNELFNVLHVLTVKGTRETSGIQPKFLFGFVTHTVHLNSSIRCQHVSNPKKPPEVVQCSRWEHEACVV